jgi:hypothetical protein
VIADITTMRDRIRAAMTAANLSNQAVANLAGGDVSRETVRVFLAGRLSAWGKVAAIANAVGVSGELQENSAEGYARG